MLRNIKRLKVDERYSLYYIQQFAFNMIGINVLSKNKYNFITSPLRLTINYASVLMLIYFQYCYVRNFYTDIVKVADGLCYIVAGSMVFVKSLVFLIRREKVNQIMDKLNKMSDHISPEEREIWVDLNRREQRFGIFYYVLCWAVSLLCFVQPLIDLMSKYVFKADIVELSLPVQGIYFYDISKMPFYLLTCFLYFFMSVFIVNYEIGVDTTFSWFVHNMAVHFRVLHARLARVAHEMAMASKTTTPELRYKLGKVLNYHKQVVNFVQQFDEVYCPNIFVQVVYSCIQLFICVFLARVGTGASFIIFTLTATSSVLMQCMFYCFGGQWVQNESEAICNDFYSMFPWHNLDNKTRRSLILALLRSQKTSILTAYFFIADNNLFVTILKSASSFVALFRAINDNETDSGH